ncbi:MAG: hypothetical protein IJC43_08490 [Clostridia bacterium]|nr:hypothetical protein [Clostridia bacterium]
MGRKTAALLLVVLALLTVAGLNRTAGELVVDETPGAVLGVRREEDGLVVTLFDRRYAVPERLVRRFEAGQGRLVRVLRLLAPVEWQRGLGLMAAAEAWWWERGAGA